MRRKLTPQTAGTDRQLAQLVRDRVTTKHCSFMVDGKSVSFVQQRGNGPLALVTLPKREFNQLVRFYLEG